jgi:hypothetical protein
MKLAAATGIVVTALAIATWSTLAGSPQNGGPRTSGQHAAASSGLIALATPVGDHRQQLMVVDPELRVMSVYHVDGATGEIVLKSVRNIHWDLQMMEFNGTSPTPREIRTQLEQR